MSVLVKNYNFFCAIAVLIGTIVGAGTFGLPFVFAKAGFTAGILYLLALTAVVLAIHLVYGEIILRTNGSHRLVGYAAKYLGPQAKILTTAVALFEYYGALLAYTILGGEFLRIVLGRFFSGSANFWALIFFALGALAIGWGLKFISGSELAMTLGMIAVIALIVLKGWPQINYLHFSGGSWRQIFLPYGVILFALAGSVAVPEMRQILAGQEQRLKKAIFWGTIIPAVLYFFFVWAVIGISGPATSEDAISGLVSHSGGWIVQIGAIFGLLAVYTSFIVLGESLKNIYAKDYGLSKPVALFLTCFAPLAIYLAGVKSFILVIGFVGAVAAGLDGILTVLIFLRAKEKGERKPEYSLLGSRVLANLLIFIFSLGLVASLLSFFK